jgi:hypothetical protein
MPEFFTVENPLQSFRNDYSKRMAITKDINSVFTEISMSLVKQDWFRGILINKKPKLDEPHFTIYVTTKYNWRPWSLAVATSYIGFRFLFEIVGNDNRMPSDG